MNKQIEKYTYFRSFWLALQNRPDNVRLEVRDAMDMYAFTGEVPTDLIERMSEEAESLLILILPIIKKSLVKSINGRKGGAPKGNSNAQKQAVVDLQKQPKNNLACFTETTKENEEKERTKEKEESLLKIKKENTSKEVKEKKENRFVKPTLIEVQQYCQERRNDVNADAFLNFYESKGWKVGNQPMKDWKAAVRTWERRNGSRQKQKFDIPQDSSAYFGEGGFVV